MSGDAYVLTEADRGRVLVVAEVAQNARGSTTTQTTPVGPVLGPPRSIAAPALTGTADVGGTLAFAAGFEDGVTLAYAWSRCAAACTPIDGATGAGLRRDRGRPRLRRCRWWPRPRTRRARARPRPPRAVRADAAGRPPTDAADHAADDAEADGRSSPPCATRPAVTGLPRPTRLLTCTTGRWANAPTRYAYRWLRNGALLKGTARTYRVRPPTAASAWPAA